MQNSPLVQLFGGWLAANKLAAGRRAREGRARERGLGRADRPYTIFHTTIVASKLGILFGARARHHHAHIYIYFLHNIVNVSVFLMCHSVALIGATLCRPAPRSTEEGGPERPSKEGEHYSIIRKIGEGSFGVIYLGREDMNWVEHFMLLYRQK